MRNPLDLMFSRRPYVCPWWCCFTFDNPLRRLIHNPSTILSPYVWPGSTAVDIGPGMGYFTIELCRLVGKEGKVVAVDLQERMLAAIRRRAIRAGVSDRLETRLTGPARLDVDEKADFVLAFWMVHEVPDQGHFMKEVSGLLRPGGQFLLAEPYLHVGKKAFQETLRKANDAGLTGKEEPAVSFSRAMLFSSSSNQGKEG
jgi:ubiquinone/menaquinone biosynthesis C-methylase UbiE